MTPLRGVRIFMAHVCQELALDTLAASALSASRWPGLWLLLIGYLPLWFLLQHEYVRESLVQARTLSEEVVDKQCELAEFAGIGFQAR